MEGYSYAPSHPDSGQSSPRSREIDYENTSASWDDSLNPQMASVYKAKLMCSYGGKILPRPHDNQLSYVGGETKIIAVDRNIKFSSLLAKLSGFCDNDTVSFKYQLPGEDLDALISVTNDEDLENLLQEYDRLYKVSPKPARLRLFLFGANPGQATPSNSSIETRSFGSEDGVTTKSEKERFVEALNSVQPSPLAASASHLNPAGNVDFLFGSEKGMAPPPPQQHLQPPMVAGRTRDSQYTVHEPVLPDPAVVDEKLQKHILDLQRLSIEAQHQAMYRKKNDDIVSGAYPMNTAGDYSFPKLHENVSQMTAPAATVTSMQPGTGYWTENQVPSGGFSGNEHLYMIQTPQGAYGHPQHHPQMMRPVTGPTTQGYYALQNMPQEAYSNQPVAYNIAPSMPTPVRPVAAATSMIPVAATTPVIPVAATTPVIRPVAAATLPNQQPVKVTAYSEGYGVVRPSGGGYAQVAYDNNGIGRQVYYNAHGGGGGLMAGPLPIQQQASTQFHQATVSGVNPEVKALNPEAVRFTGKANQASI